MKSNKMNQIAYILIISSLFIFALASYVSLDKVNIYSNEERTYGEISVTTKPEEEIEKNDDTKNITAEDNKSGSKPSNSSNGGKSSSSTGKTSTSGTAGSKGNTSNKSINNKPTPTPNYVDVNNAARISLENQYNINILYGKETNGYVVGGMNTIALSDTNRIARAINSLRICLSRYPANIFRETTSVYPLNIYLIDKFSTNNVTGVTDSTTRTVSISIATAYSFDVSLHHEMFHYLEHYIFYKGGSYNTWNSLNPTGFTYGNVNSNWAFSKTQSPDAYFVNDYAMYSDAEDRASTFEYMTAGYKASCLNNGKPVYKKAKYMAQTMEYYLNSVSPSVTEYWERYL
ncbi:MAG: hypothetical protein IJI43_00625 [Bacilli bacterium]|nr:hypothetical protein [Bacilli bacterium]